jgi:translation initiation factor 2 alpha subunit (eIF-2alpha)
MSFEQDNILKRKSDQLQLDTPLPKILAKDCPIQNQSFVAMILEENKLLKIAKQDLETTSEKMIQELHQTMRFKEIAFEQWMTLVQEQHQKYIDDLKTEFAKEKDILFDKMLIAQEHAMILETQVAIRSRRVLQLEMENDTLKHMTKDVSRHIRPMSTFDWSQISIKNKFPDTGCRKKIMKCLTHMKRAAYIDMIPVCAPHYTLADIQVELYYMNQSGCLRKPRMNSDGLWEFSMK